MRTAAEADAQSVSDRDMPVVVSYLVPSTGNPIDVTRRWEIEMNLTCPHFLYQSL